MGKVSASISVSLDGFAAGPKKPPFGRPLGTGGLQVEEWAFRLAAWRSQHGLEGGETGEESAPLKAAQAATGTIVMGHRDLQRRRRPSEADENREGWWGDDPPFRVPGLPSSPPRAARPRREAGRRITFVTDGVGAALAEARLAAAGRDVAVAGGASVLRQALELDLVDELVLHLAPVLRRRGGLSLPGRPEGQDGDRAGLAQLDERQVDREPDDPWKSRLPCPSTTGKTIRRSSSTSRSASSERASRALPATRMSPANRSFRPRTSSARSPVRTVVLFQVGFSIVAETMNFGIAFISSPNSPVPASPGQAFANPS